MFLYTHLLTLLQIHLFLQDNISVENPIAKKDYDCYDEDKAWLYSDGDILFGREETVDQDGYIIPADAPFPLVNYHEAKDLVASWD